VCISFAARRMCSLVGRVSLSHGYEFGSSREEGVAKLACVPVPCSALY
jgi:hypothetical protein